MISLGRSVYTMTSEKYMPEIEIFWNRAPGAIAQGASWPEELKRRTRDTKHMIAIWSNKAGESNEVRQEIADFQANVHEHPEKNGVKRKLLYMPLEGEATGALEQPQNLFYMRELSTYDPNVEDRGTAKLETPPHREAWQQTLRIILDTVQTTQPINLAVLVTTTSNVGMLQATANQIVGPGPSAIEYLQAAGLTLAQAIQRYGATAFDWTPFGSNRKIKDLMQGLRMVVNAGLEPSYRFHWVECDLLSQLARFNNDYDGMCRWLETFAQRPSVIVIDGLSLCNPVIMGWIPHLRGYAAKEHVVIVSLAPHEAPTAALLYEVMRSKAAPVFESYFNPKIPSAGTFAHCRVNVEHIPDIARLLRGSLGAYYLAQQKLSGKDYTGMGG
jgi:hypothetical protein